MSTHFDEKWLEEYQRRTGKAVTGQPKVERVAVEAATEAKQARTKYGNQKTVYAGRVFDSKHEADSYRELELRAMAGELRAVLCQVPFTLPGGVKYIADFVTLNNDGTYTVLDAKSEATKRDKVYRLKKRLMKECLGIEIAEV